MLEAPLLSENCSGPSRNLFFQFCQKLCFPSYVSYLVYCCVLATSCFIYILVRPDLHLAISLAATGTVYLINSGNGRQKDYISV